MGSISDYLEDKLIGHTLSGIAYTRPTTVYLGLSTADPLDTAAGLAEPVGNNYSRVAITFGAASARRITQNATATFAQASGAWGTIAHWGIFDAASAGNLLAYGALSVAKSVVSGNTPRLDSGGVYIEFSAGGISTYLSNILLDFVFRNQAYAVPATYIALTTATIADTSTGTTITEPAGNAYARKLVNINGGASPAWSTSSGGVVSNGTTITFATPTGSWGTIVAMGIVDALTVGNLLFYDNTNVVDQAVAVDDVVSIASGALQVTMS